MLLSTDGTNLDQLFFQKCNESFGLDLPVNIQNVRQSFPSNINQSSQEVVDETETEKINDWSSPQKVVHLLVWEINPIRNMKGGLKWLRKDTNPKKS
jgi:hypothetical protein